MSYYGQAIGGHLALNAKKQSINKLLERDNTPQELKYKLTLVQRIRAYAINNLGLPNNGSYTAYADLGRPAATWIVTAAPAISLTPHEWCYVVVGCLTYRGYFRESAAQAHAEELLGQGLDVVVSPATAYSTLGWSKDPVLNTMIRYDELDLAELIFHELTHALIYVADDAPFNEALATAVGRIGAEHYAITHGLLEDLSDWRDWQERRSEIHEMLVNLRQDLAEVYAMEMSMEDKLRAKGDVVLAFRQAFTAAGFGDPDRWYGASGPNNAHLALHQTYTGHVAALVNLFNASASMEEFLRSVESLARLSVSERRKALRLTAAELANGDMKQSVQRAEDDCEAEERSEESNNDSQLDQHQQANKCQNGQSKYAPDIIEARHIIESDCLPHQYQARPSTDHRQNHEYEINVSKRVRVGECHQVEHQEKRQCSRKNDDIRDDTESPPCRGAPVASVEFSQSKGYRWSEDQNRGNQPSDLAGRSIQIR